MRIVTTTFLAFFICLGCLERFDPPSTKLTDILVVEGHLSNLNEANTIRLSRATAIGDNDVMPELNAIVTVVDGNLKSYAFEETAAGVYQNSTTDLVGEEGETYQLDIITAAGDHYISALVKFKKTPALGKVYFEGETRLTNDRSILSGIGVYLDTFDPTRSTSYYRWEWVENWEIQVPVPSKFDFKVDKDTVGMGYPIPKAIPVDVCYNSSSSTRVMVASTKTLSEDRVKKYEINFVSTRGFKLRSLYGVIVKQYALDETGYKYWEALRASSEAVGTLFDPQPYPITGNIFNVDDPSEPVLGFFDASTVSFNSLVIIRDQLDSIIFPFEQCFEEKDTVPYRLVQDYLQSGYLIDTVGPFGSTYVIMAPIDCSDCRVYGTLERPKFRPD